MKKNGFTMIELIFVIVILGILAAVAIPRLSATRDDAQVSQVAQSIGNGIQEIANYVTSKGKSEDDLTAMSKAFKSLEDTGVADVDGKKAVIKMGSVDDCITVEVETNDTNDDIKISQGDSDDTQCNSLQTLIDPKKYSIILRGNSVSY